MQFKPNQKPLKSLKAKDIYRVWILSDVYRLMGHDVSDPYHLSVCIVDALEEKYGVDFYLTPV